MNRFSDEYYRHYDASEGFGTADEWAKAAEALSEKVRGRRGNRSNRKDSAGVETSNNINSTDMADLELLYLDKLPETIQGLKTAFRNCLFLVHPDYGGSNEATITTMAAFERLAALYD